MFWLASLVFLRIYFPFSCSLVVYLPFSIELSIITFCLSAISNILPMIKPCKTSRSFCELSWRMWLRKMSGRYHPNTDQTVIKCNFSSLTCFWQIVYRNQVLGFEMIKRTVTGRIGDIYLQGRHLYQLCPTIYILHTSTWTYCHAFALVA